jgi:hypothetical protein
MKLNSSAGRVADTAVGTVADTAVGRVADTAVGRVADTAVGRVADTAVGRAADRAVGRIADKAVDWAAGTIVGSPWVPRVSEENFAAAGACDKSAQDRLAHSHRRATPKDQGIK